MIQKSKINLSHDKQAFLYTAARALERGSFYGVRSILLLYMINTVNLSEGDASEIYGIFVGTIIFSQLLGGVLGDLVLGNKNAILIGGLLQSIGAFTLCIPSSLGLYTGLGLIVFGTGFFTPNILSNFGKLYLNKTKLLDGGFCMFYAAVNIGALIGTTIISLIGFSNYTIGFIVGGIMMLLSLSISFILKVPDIEMMPSKKTETNNNKKLITILGAISIVTLFWYVYDYSQYGFEYIGFQFNDNSSLHITNLLSTYGGSTFLIPIGVIASIIWSFYYSSQLQKMTTGFILGAISLGSLLFLPQNLGPGSVLIFISSLFIMSLAEIHIAPIIYSVLTKNCNPKYLSIVISLIFIPSRVSVYIIGALVSGLGTGWIPIMLGTITFAVVAIMLYIAFFLKKRKELATATEN